MKKLSYDLLGVEYNSWDTFMLKQTLPIYRVIEIINNHKDYKINLRCADFKYQYINSISQDRGFVEIILNYKNHLELNKEVFKNKEVFQDSKGSFYLTQNGRASDRVRGFYVYKNTLVFCTLPEINTLLKSALKDKKDTSDKFYHCYHDVSLNYARQLIESLVEEGSKSGI